MPVDFSFKDILNNVSILVGSLYAPLVIIFAIGIARMITLNVMKLVRSVEVSDDDGEAVAVEDDEEESEEELPELYNEWFVEDLRDELRERGLPTNGRKAVLVKRLEKDDRYEEPEIVYEWTKPLVCPGCKTIIPPKTGECPSCGAPRPI